MQVPSNLFLNKIGKPSLYLPGCMAIWVSSCVVAAANILICEQGIVCGATGAVQGFGGLIACRFLLGFVEAAYFVRSRQNSASCY